MISINQMFYGEKEDVWIVKPPPAEKKTEAEKKAEPKPIPTAEEESFGPYYPFWHPELKAPEKAPAPKKEPETKTLNLWVPICCNECEETVTLTLTQLEVVKKVTCDIPRQKVTVVVKNAAEQDAILLEVRKEFKKSRPWTKDDD